jgi:tetratricopeptide (TPR) repeat protein
MVEAEARAAKPTRRRGWKSRLIAILIGLSPLLLLEAFLQATNYGGGRHVDFVAESPAFVVNDGVVSLAPERRSYLRTRPFAAEKPTGTIRIFVVGDSSAYGFTFMGDRDPEGKQVVLPRPYAVLLEESLRDRHPERKFEVLNCGACGCATYRLKGLARELLRYSPDVMVFLAGSSEFLESRLFKDWERVREQVGFLAHVKSLTLARDLLRKARGGNTNHRKTVKNDSPFLPILDEDVIRGPFEVEALLEHSEFNLREIVEACREASVPLVLCTVPSNLRIPPRVLLHEIPKAKQVALADVSDEQTARFEEAFSRAGELVDAGRFDQALEYLGSARLRLADDPRIAGLHFISACAFEGREDWEQARRFYVLAKDRDPYLWRATSGFNEIVRELAERPGVHLADLEKSFRQALPDGIPDSRLFFDRNHPRPAGHRLIAEKLVEVLESHHLVNDGS